MKEKNIFWNLLKDFFTIFLPKQRNVSPHTIEACHNTWNMFLGYLRDEKGLTMQQIKIELFDSILVNEYLDYMEKERVWKVSTRNHRLSCIRLFFNYASMIDPSLYSYAVNLKTIPQKKGVNKSHVIDYLSQSEMKDLLSEPDPATKLGLRDQFFMSLMYDTAARNCEMLSLKCTDLNFETSTVYLLGKGNKPRLVPVSKDNITLARNYYKLFHIDSLSSSPIFYVNHKKEKSEMSDDNVSRFIKKYAKKIKQKNTDMPERIHPHMLRKSRAMHLYRAGMPLALLAEFLGHEDPQTTLIYAYADTEMKRTAIEKASSHLSVFNKDTEAIWKGNDDIISRLCRGY